MSVNQVIPTPGTALCTMYSKQTPFSRLKGQKVSRISSKLM